MNIVGMSATQPSSISHKNWYGSNPPTVVASDSIRPVLRWTMFKGISPKKVASANWNSGTSNAGEDMLINQFGSSGVILRNNMYQNRFPSCSFRLPENQIILPGIHLTIKLLPRTHETQYQMQAPEVAHRHTKENPRYGPNRAPERMLKNTAPGIANVCKNTYKQQNAASTSVWLVCVYALIT